MRATVAALVLLGMAGWVVAAPAQTPPPSFGYYQCLCQASSPGLAPTPSQFGQPSVSSWRGTVYALSANDARFKAKNACVAENRGSSLLCDACLCSK
jgi:hypothetical protein